MTRYFKDSADGVYILNSAATPSPDWTEITKAEGEALTAPSAEQVTAQAAAATELADRVATIQDPFVSALAGMTRAEVVSDIDTKFAGMTNGQRQSLKAIALSARFAIRKGIQ